SGFENTSKIPIANPVKTQESRRSDSACREARSRFYLVVTNGEKSVWIYEKPLGPIGLDYCADAVSMNSTVMFHSLLRCDLLSQQGAQESSAESKNVKVHVGKGTPDWCR